MIFNRYFYLHICFKKLFMFENERLISVVWLGNNILMNFPTPNIF